MWELFRSNRRTAIAICGLSAVVCISGAIILQQGRRIVMLEASITETKPGALSPGYLLHTFDVQDRFGALHKIEFPRHSDKPTLLYVFRPSCRWCQSNSSNLRIVMKHVLASYDVVGISLEREGLDKFIEQEAIEFPVYTDLTLSTRNLYRLGVTPETIVVSPQGRVLRTWLGAYMNEPVKSEVERFFSVRFPSS